MNLKMRRMAQEALSEFFDNLLEQVGKEKEGERVESHLTEAERAERYAAAAELFDDLLGSSSVEALEEAAGVAEDEGKGEPAKAAADLFDDLLGGGDPVAEAEPGEQAEEGKRTIAVPRFRRDLVHGLAVEGYEQVAVEEGEPTDEELEAMERRERYEQLLDILGGA